MSRKANRLEIELQRELENSRIVACRDDASEVAGIEDLPGHGINFAARGKQSVEVADRVGEVRMIEQIVEFKPSTVRAAESHLSQHIVKRLGNIPLRDMNAKNLQAFVTTTAATGVARKTLENILQTVFSILRTARMFGKAMPPVKRADLMLPREEAKRDVRFLSAKEVGQIQTATCSPTETEERIQSAR